MLTLILFGYHYAQNHASIMHQGLSGSIRQHCVKVLAKFNNK